MLAFMHAQPRQLEPAIHDRQTDYIIGIPLMVAALLVNRLLPSKLSAMFWVWRIDLLTLPFFVAGAVAVIFGVRVLWRQKVAVGFLLLAWPYPYTTVLLSVLNAFTSATLFAMAHVVKFTHLATLVGPLSGGVFSVVHNGHPFSLSVVSACSGVSSVVGFLLVGVAFAATVRGPWIRKTLWLLGGMVLLWAINVGRITLIFWAGREEGEHFRDRYPPPLHRPGHVQHRRGDHDPVHQAAGTSSGRGARSLQGPDAAVARGGLELPST